MAISIDWATKIISVPQSFLSSLGGSSYQLDTNEFRIALRDIEDNVDGIVFPPTHNHNTKVLLGGIEYARILEIINGYTITFEDVGSPYRVFLIGSNNNILDVTNLNNVSVAPNNSAGLVQMQEIEFNEYKDGIYVDILNGSAGTLHPTGTLRKPSSNLTDAMTIANVRGVGIIRVIGDATIDSGGDYSDMVFIGESHEKSVLTISSAANVQRAEFYSSEIAGILDGDALLYDCLISDLEYVNGEIKECVLKPPGVMELGGSDHAIIARCVTDCNEGGEPYTVDMGGSDQTLAIRDLSGAVKLTNKTGIDGCSLVMAGGQVTLDLENMTAGTVYISGVCDVVDELGDPIYSGLQASGVTVINNALSNDNITSAIWSHVQNSGYTAEELLDLIACVNAAKLSGADTTTINIRDLGDTKNRVVATVDEHGNREAVTLDTT